MHGYGNIFRGDAAAAYVVRVWNNGASERLRRQRNKLAQRVYALATLGEEEKAAKLEKWLYSVKHCGDIPAEW